MENQGVSTPFSISDYEQYVNATATNLNLSLVNKEQALSAIAANIFSHSWQARAGLANTVNAFMSKLEINNISKDSIERIITRSFVLIDHILNPRIRPRIQFIHPREYDQNITLRISPDFGTFF